ncbi:glycosyl hydrolase [Lasiosphaeria miniovina]|uniref:Glycosyl hydrolase n=1 Tax=Lasiosphaeria miniovina TaxID=1954250 RepID=A0AA40DYX2_9PEZI|nr:glycosyl hydrolase [Lasiosphaeria miniovina]KAK0721624.1 glycosyl hydrolase [Lasiosphaeria miniovina]
MASARTHPLRGLAVALLLSLSCLALSTGARSIDTTVPAADIAKRADPSLAGYLGVFFLGADPYVYFYLSSGNDPVAFKALNRGAPVMRPTKGTGGVRDPSIIAGSGADAGKKWYIIGTDLNIGKTTWDASQRTGSKGIFVWESTDLLTWTNERLVTVEDSTAGMVWAPDAIWDPAKEQYLVHWASKFYPTSDTRHTGSPSNIRIRYAHTRDFVTFTTPQTLIDKALTDVIDLSILQINATSYVRFLKDESKKNVFAEVSSSGLFGAWTRPGGSGAYIASGVEGPAAFWDNEVPGKAHLLLDFYGGDGYRPYESTVPGSNSAWTASSRSAFPANLRHGSVLPVTQPLYDALRAKWA